MVRKLTGCACALLALLLLCSDARAQVCGPVYGGYGYAASYSYAPSYYSTPSYSYAASYSTPSYGYAASYYAPSYSYAASYSTPSYGYGTRYGGYGYRGYGYRYNPGGLGGPYSGLGVRPGLGYGGFGLRR
jgi:hypothetical protein